jgi:hypothetical protein
MQEQDIVELVVDSTAQVRHVGHCIIKGLEALRLEIRAHAEAAALASCKDWDARGHMLELQREADQLGTEALQDTLSAEQMDLADITVRTLLDS